jgi:glutamate/tyrosine decarboxylase-like PLP-dependent enzyme
MMDSTTNLPTSHILTTLQKVTDLLTSTPSLSAQIHSSPATNPFHPILPLIPSKPTHHTSLPSSPILPASGPNPLLTHLSHTILPYLSLSSLSPSYYGFVTGGCTPAALAADILTSIYDQNTAVHLPAESIATRIDVAALNMLLDLFCLPRDIWGLPMMAGDKAGGAGTFTTGATASNVLGLAMGREWVLTRGTKMSVGEDGLVACMRAADVPFVKVLSTMPHSSIAKAASIVGLGRGSVVSIAVDKDPLKIDMEKLTLEIAKESGRGRFILCISAGEVNTGRFATGSLGQMKELREVCDREGIWIHVDGAFGLFGRVLMGADGDWPEAYEEVVKGCQGLELADSITGDGHKLLNVPYDCGFFFTSHRGLSEKVFQNGNAAYLSAGAVSADGISSSMNIGIENSQRFRSLPVYATLTQYGRSGYQDMLMRQIGLARLVAGWVFDHPEFELLPTGDGKVQMLAKTFIIVLFRTKDASKDEELVKKINAQGQIYVTGTRWDDRPAARIAVSNWQVSIARDSQKIFEVLQRVVSE